MVSEKARALKPSFISRVHRELQTTIYMWFIWGHKWGFALAIPKHCVWGDDCLLFLWCQKSYGESRLGEQQGIWSMSQGMNISFQLRGSSTIHLPWSFGVSLMCTFVTEGGGRKLFRKGIKGKCREGEVVHSNHAFYHMGGGRWNPFWMINCSETTSVEGCQGWGSF